MEMPHDINNEKAALGCMIKDSDGAACVFDMLKYSDFYDLNHQAIFKAGKILFDRGEPVDMVTVAHELKADALDKVGGPVYLVDLVEMVPSTANAAHYCRIIADESKKRQLLHFAREVERGATDKTAPADFDALRKRLDEIARDMPGDPTRSVAERLQGKRDREKEREPGELLGYRLTRFEKIGKAIDGVQPGFYIFAGITHVGKTLFLTNIFLDLLKSNPDLHGIYFSLDDNENVIINRLLAILCGGALRINEIQRRVADKERARELEGAYNELIGYAKSGRFNILDFSQIQTIEAVEAVIRGYIRNDQKLFVVIDGLQNIETGKEYGGLREKMLILRQASNGLLIYIRFPS